MGDTRKRPVSTMRHGRRIRNDWDFLAAISHMYSEIDVSKFQSEEDRQRGLFILVLYMNESLKKKADERTMVFSRALLQSFYEDMFFRKCGGGDYDRPGWKKRARFLSWICVT